MAYIPNPFDPSQPVDAVFAGTAAAEFRALKGSMIALQAALAADSTLFLGDWSAQTGVAVLGNIVIHAGKAWMAVVAIADITTAEPGVSASWLPMGTYKSPLDNLVLNGNFARNTRGVSGSVVLAAGQLGHDMWYAGAGGCTYTFAAGVITITAGTLKTAVWGELVQADNYTASHGGTAAFAVNGGASTVAPKTVAMAAATNIVLEFAAGTVKEVVVSRGEAVVPFVALPKDQQANLVGYYVRKQLVLVGNNATAVWPTGFGGTAAQLYFPTQSMRALPSLSWINNVNIQYYGFTGLWTGSALTGSVAGDADGMTVSIAAIADGDGRGKLMRKTSAGDVFAVLSAELTP